MCHFTKLTCVFFNCEEANKVYKRIMKCVIKMQNIVQNLEKE